LLWCQTSTFKINIKKSFIIGLIIMPTTLSIKSGGTYPLVKLGMGITARIMDITPDLADKWLEKNPRVNRNMSQAEVDMLVRHSENNEIMFNGQPIIFDNRDRLSDGQHRLAACRKSGKPFMCLVIWGVDPKAFATIDAGRARSARDALKSEGVLNQTAIASACQILYRIENNLPVSHYGIQLKLSPMEILQICKTHKNLENYHAKAYDVGRLIHNMGIAVACRWLFDRVNLKDAEDFYTKVAEGTNLSKGDPILLLRNELMPARLNINMTAPMMIIAWNAYRKKEELKKFVFQSGKPLPPII
jgi:hypothetical protein